jgi:hypothetical protein
MTGAIWDPEPTPAPSDEGAAPAYEYTPPPPPPARAEYEREIQLVRKRIHKLRSDLPAAEATDGPSLVARAAEIADVVSQLGGRAENEAEQDLHGPCRLALSNLTSAVADRLVGLLNPVPAECLAGAYPALRAAIEQRQRDRGGAS